MNEIKIHIEEDIVAVLQRRAEESGRTVEQEAEKIVADDIAGRLRPVDPVEWSRRIRAMSPRGVQQTDSLELIREGRDR